jgi:CDP-6-deoxy-D-xylo-4-hexulose-3-dehydrase
MPNEMKWPLMKNNVSRKDLDLLIKHLMGEDPKLTHGPLVKEFEEKWSNWLGVKYSVMLNSGASANDLTMQALKVKYGPGEVIVPGLTWVSDIASVLHAGLEPVFVDINMNNLAMNEDAILNAISPRTKAVFLTHILGLNGLTDSMLQFLEQKGIPLIEDVCESHGATHNNVKLGSFGLASNFSFYYAHHMTTIEGGIVSTNDEDLYQTLRMMRSHGMVREANSETRLKYNKEYPDLNPDFIFAFASHNMRPNELNGILGLSQLERLDKNVISRRIKFQTFLDLLNPRIFHTDLLLEGNSNYAFILILKEANFQNRDLIELKLAQYGIEFRRGLSGGGNQLRQPYLRSNGHYPAPESLPNVDHVHNYGWYLGNYPELDNDFFTDLKHCLAEIESLIVF